MDLIEWVDNQRSGRGIADYYERCDDRDTTVLAVRRLMTAHIGEVSDLVTMEARVLTALEWAADYSERERS